MKKIDRLGWAAGFSIKTYGLRIGIRANDSAALDRVRAHLPQDWRTISSPVVDRLYSIVVARNGSHGNVRRFNLLYGDHVRLARSVDTDEVFDTFESDLRLVVAEYARRRVFVHAGVVGWQGRAIVIPGRSFSGKSTLVAELVRAGACYYSDEFAVFDSRGRVHPFLKPLEIRDPGEFRQTKIEVARLGGKPGRGSLPVGMVLVTQFRDGVRFRPRKLSPGNGVLELLSNTVSARRDPENTLATLQHVVAHAEVLKGARGDAHVVANTILEQVARKKRDR